MIRKKCGVVKVLADGVARGVFKKMRVLLVWWRLFIAVGGHQLNFPPRFLKVEDVEGQICKYTRQYAKVTNFFVLHPLVNHTSVHKVWPETLLFSDQDRVNSLLCQICKATEYTKSTFKYHNFSC